METASVCLHRNTTRAVELWKSQALDAQRQSRFRFQTFGNNVAIGAAEFEGFVTLRSTRSLSLRLDCDNEIAALIFGNSVSSGRREARNAEAFLVGKGAFNS